MHADRIQKVKTIIQAQLEDINKLTGINSLILAVCLVDTLAGFYCGFKGQKNGNKDRYLKFVDKYLKTHQSYLYDVRCNLTHSFSNTVSNFLFIDSKEFSNVFPNTTEILDWKVFNIDIFKKDLQAAIDNYFNELHIIPNDELFANFTLRFEHLNILEDGVIPTIKNLKGEMISTYHELDTLPGIDLKIAMFDQTKIKK